METSTSQPEEKQTRSRRTLWVTAGFVGTGAVFLFEQYVGYLMGKIFDTLPAPVGLLSFDIPWLQIFGLLMLGVGVWYWFRGPEREYSQKIVDSEASMAKMIADSEANVAAMIAKTRAEVNRQLHGHPWLCGDAEMNLIRQQSDVGAIVEAQLYDTKSSTENLHLQVQALQVDCNELPRTFEAQMQQHFEHVGAMTDRLEMQLEELKRRADEQSQE